MHKILFLSFIFSFSISELSYSNNCGLPDSPIFDTELEAVIYASKKYNPDSVKNDIEYIGGIVKNDKNKFLFSVSKGSFRKGKISANLKFKDTCNITSVWHTHGAKRWSSIYFSDIDTNFVNEKKIPMYMISYNNIIRIYRPGEKTISKFRARRLGLGNLKGFSKGKYINKI